MQAFSKLAAAHRRGGPAAVVRAALSAALQNPRDRRLDRELPASTATKVAVQDLGAGGPNASSAVEYAPTPSAVLDGLLADLPGPLEAFTFVDFGSGKGRALLLAACRPFKAVVGVEFSPELHRAAEANIAYCGLQDRATSTLGDATLLQIPDEPCVFYFYNPFDASVLRRVLDKIAISHARHPRPMLFIYLNPQHATVFEECTFLRRRPRPVISRIRHALLTADRALIYELA